MSRAARLEGAAMLVAFLACAAFIASFAIGLRRDSPATTAASAGPSRVPAAEVPAVRAAGRVEVLNASGQTGLARAATDRLRSGGFDVVYFGNASGFSGDSTLIIDRTGDDAVARAVARFLGTGVVRTDPDTTRFVDATVIIGRDWR